MAVFHNLTKAVQFLRPVNSTAAGTSKITGGAVDTLGFDAACFIFLFGASTTGQVTNCEVDGCATSGGTYYPLQGSGTSPLADTADANLVQVIDVYKPTTRYLKPVINRGTANQAVDGVICILYHTEVAPPPFGASIAAATGATSQLDSVLTLNQPACNSTTTAGTASA